MDKKLLLIFLCTLASMLNFMTAFLYHGIIDTGVAIGFGILAIYYVKEYFE